MTEPIIRFNDTEQTVLFESGRIGGGGADTERYTSVIVYIFRHKGEPPSIIIRPGADCYTLAVARRQAQHMTDAIAWIEANVPELGN